MDVTGTISVTANNVTIKNTRVTDSGSNCGSVSCWAISVASNVTGLVIQDSTVRGANATTSAIEADVRTGANVHMTLLRDYLYNAPDPILAVYSAGTQYTVSDSYVISNGDPPPGGWHKEDIYINASTVNANHNTLLNPDTQTATVFGDTNGGGNSFTVTDSLLAGGGFLVYPQANHSGSSIGSMNISNNNFARCTTSPVYNSSSGGTSCSGGADSHGYWPYGGYFDVDAYIYCTGTGNTWANNKWDDNGSAVGC